MGNRLAKGFLGLSLSLVLLLSSIPTVASSSSYPNDTPPPASEGSAGQAVEVDQVTLITGDVITVAVSVNGTKSFTITPADPARLGQNFLTVEENGDTYIFPDGVDLEKLDKELFNIDYLVDEQYYLEPSLPLLVSYSPGLPAFSVQSLKSEVETLGEETKLLKEAGAISTRLDYQGISPAYESLASAPQVDKIWLDKKYHVQLSESVPLTGAPSYWATGYNGTGVKIAVLDTGIDTSHPALNDLDDNPATVDPKVTVNVNFTDDSGFNDLFGHGTHVAGIAAGTAAGGNYTGVAPGAWLWNIKVLNRYGYGYESWIINGVNFASFGPDGVAGTGDEADIISMSLGGGKTDGTDPLSQAVGLAVDRGVTVVVAAGNSGSGMSTIGSPAVAEKVITVGASGKDDTLAYFSSRGPTTDGRIKPDILAPGVSIVSSVPTGNTSVINDPSGNKSLSGTSMATPHVAGAAALLLQRYGGNTTPQFIKDTLMSASKDLGYNVYEQGAGRLDLSRLLSPVYSENTSSMTWSQEALPSDNPSVNQLVPGSDVTDLSVASDGNTIYAVSTAGNMTFKSTNGGKTWTRLNVTSMTGSPKLVASAPTSAEMVVIADTTANVSMSADGGTTFSRLTGHTIASINAIAISPAMAFGQRDIALAGTRASDGTADIQYLQVGDVPGSWVSMRTMIGWVDAPFSGTANVSAIAFSPNFAGDRTMVAITATDSSALFEIASFATQKWNGPAYGTGYPKTIATVVPIVASISLAPTYLASDDTLRLAFVALSGANPWAGGLFRLNNTTMTTLEGVLGMRSVDFNGTALVAGTQYTNNVLRSANPLATTPIVLDTPRLDRPGGDGAVVVAWAGGNVAAGTSGANSAFAISRDSGFFFVDLSLVDTRFVNIEDLVVSSDGKTLYTLVDDNVTPGDLSVWRKTTAWERVFRLNVSPSMSPGYILRADTSGNISDIYIINTAETDIYYKNRPDQNSWVSRSAVGPLADVAIEHSEATYATVYALTASGGVFKSTDGGFTWEPRSGLMSGGATINSIKPNQLVVGGDGGEVIWSREGFTSFEAGDFPFTSGRVQVTTDNLDNGNYIYAASDTSAKIGRWQVGTSSSWDIKDLPMPIGSNPYGVYGLKLSDGVLYALTWNGTDSALYGTYTNDWNSLWKTPSTASDFNRVPQALKSSAGKLWAIDDGSSDALYSLEITSAHRLAPEVLVTPASLSLGRFTSGNTAARGTFTFYNMDNVSHSVSLSANLTDVYSGVDYSTSVNLSTSGGFLIPGGSGEVNLNIDLTALPSSLYSGKLLATVDNTTSIHAIFGFEKVSKVTVRKTDINGAPAQKHYITLLSLDAVSGLRVTGLSTNQSGEATVYLRDGNYDLLSYNAANQTSIWTVAENVTVAGDMTIILDERETRVIDFYPGKPGFIPAAKSASLYSMYGIGFGTSTWWYPQSFVTRVSPISARFNAGFTYQAFPQQDFNPADPSLVNTGEWLNLSYSVDNITGNVTLAADYPNLVRRETAYGVALNGERAYWSQSSWSPAVWGITSFTSQSQPVPPPTTPVAPSPPSIILSYQMDAPRVRTEWLSPQPVYYSQNYQRASYEPGNSWYFSGGSGYPSGNWSYTMGSHPFISGVYTGVSWNVAPLPPPTTPPPTPAPPPASVVSNAELVNRLNVYGNISRDAAGNYFANYVAGVSGRLKVTANSTKVILERDIWNSVYGSVDFSGTANLTVEVWAQTGLQLSSSSYTRFDIIADPTHDARPPDLIRINVPGINPYGIVPGGPVKVQVLAKDESLISGVSLHYSTGDNTTWLDAGAPTFENGYYVFNLGQLWDTFVSVAVDATDQYGNHIQRVTNRAFYVANPAVQVKIEAPARVVPGSNFTAKVNVNQIESLDAANYDISFNPAVLRLDSVTAGSIGAGGNWTAIPIDVWNSTSNGTVTIVQNVPGISGVSGTGDLAILHFQVVGPLSSNSSIALTGGVLSNNLAQGIPAAWIGGFVQVSVLPGDASGDGKVNAIDITKVERIIARLDGPTPGADANQDGNVNALDITKVERIIVGLDI